MRRQKLKAILLIVLIVIFAKYTEVNAASVSLNVPSKVNVGDTITASISGKAEQWNLELTANGTSIAKPYNLTNEGSEISISSSGTYKATKEGTVTFKLTGDYSYTSGNDVKTQEVDITKTVTVTEKENTPTPTQNSEVSSDATLTNLGINPNDFTGFEKNKTTYNVSVPKETSTINIYANKRTGQTVTGLGKKNLNIGENTFNVVVTAADKKTTKTYTLNIKRESISKVATLKNLGIRPNDFSGFKAGIYTYNVNVPKDVEKISIYAEKTNAASTVTGTGEKTLNEGKNTFNVIVTAEDKKTTKTYTLNINRIDEKKSEEPENDSKEEPKDETDAKGLIDLEIAGITLTPKFSNNVYEYKIEAKDDIEKLDIKTKTSSDKISVEIIGNEKLEIGENLITLLVKNEDGTKTTYQITANLTPTPVDVTNLNNELNGAQDKIQKQKIAVIAILGIVFILIIVFFVEKYKIKKGESEEFFDEEDEEDEEEKLEENRYDNEIIESNSKKEISKEDDDDEVFKQILEERGFNTHEEFEDTRQKKWNAKGKRYK